VKGALRAGIAPAFPLSLREWFRGGRDALARVAGPAAAAQQAVGATALAALAAGLGLVLVAVADDLGRRSSGGAMPLFWVGMLALWLPAAAVVFSPRASPTERITALVVLGTAMYLVHVLYSPIRFSGHDEFLHWQTASNIVRTGKIFNENSLLPVSPLYPALEVTTTALVKLTGLSIFAAGAVVVGTARLVLVLALYLLYERIGGSSRLAAVATLVYFTNPKFLLFDSSFGYESLALSFAVLALYAVARAGELTGPALVRMGFVAIMAVAATAVTHHITSFFLVAALLLVALFSLRVRGSRRRFFLVIASLAAVVVAEWLLLVAAPVIGYLEPNVAGGVGQVINLIRGEASRRLFQSSSAEKTPPLDKVGAVVFALVTLALLVIGWWRIWRAPRWRARKTPFPAVIILCSVAYPLSSVFRLTSAGAELADRMSEFVFIPVAFCISWAVVRNPFAARVRRSLLVLGSAALLYGGIVVGYPSWLRIPGSYLVSADDRSIEPEGILAATWSRTELGAGNRIAADRINRLLMATYGRQRPVTPLADGVDVSPVYFDPRLTAFDVSLLRRGRVRYVVVDRRLATALPAVGIYIDAAEKGALVHRSPISAAAVRKLDRTQGVSRIFDSGDIRIYDVSRLERR
jgi:hypothetical protein